MAQEFHDWKTKGLKIVHLSYHRGRHYNSVRSRKDPGYGPAYKYPISHPLMTPEAKKAAAALEDVKEEEKQEGRENDYLYQDTVYEEDTTFKTRSELIDIACRLAGVESPEIMEKAFDQVFEEKEEVIVPQLIVKIPQLMEVYTDLEMEAV